MKWKLSNSELPKKEGFYYCEDTIGQKTMVHFYNNHWHSLTGHPVKAWLDETDLKSEEPNFYKEEYDLAVNEIGQLQEQLKEAEAEIRDLQNELRHSHQ